MNISWQRFCRGFLRGVLLGAGLLAAGLLAWLITIVMGVENDKSLAGFSLASLYVASFGLGGGVLVLLRGEAPRWHQSAVAWTAALVVASTGCGIMALLLGVGRPVDWFWGAGSSMFLGTLTGCCLWALRGDLSSVIPAVATPDARRGFAVRLKRNLATRGGWVVAGILLIVLAAWIAWFQIYRMCIGMSMESWAGYAGRLQAKVWFLEGKYRLLRVSSVDKSAFTGETDGPFEVWTWPHDTNTPALTVQTADQKFVDAFNSRMRSQWNGRPEEQVREDKARVGRKTSR